MERYQLGLWVAYEFKAIKKMEKGALNLSLFKQPFHVFLFFLLTPELDNFFFTLFLFSYNGDSENPKNLSKFLSNFLWFVVIIVFIHV